MMEVKLGKRYTFKMAVQFTRDNEIEWDKMALRMGRLLDNFDGYVTSASLKELEPDNTT